MLVRLEGRKVFKTHLWIALCVVYVSSVLGIAAKFWRNGVRGRSLWVCLWLPLLTVILPAMVLLTIYVPGFNNDVYSVASKLRKLRRGRITFPVQAVFTSVQYIPLFTSILARKIVEIQRETADVRTKDVWVQTARQVVPYLAVKLEMNLL